MTIFGLFVVGFTLIKGGVRWSRCWTYMMAKVSEMNRENFFKNFSISPSAGGLAGRVLLAFSYTQSTHLHTTLLQFHTPVRRFIIHLFCIDFRSILTLEAPNLQESGTVPDVSKMTPSMIQFCVCIPICCHSSIDGVIFETSRTVPDSWRSQKWRHLYYCESLPLFLDPFWVNYKHIIIIIIRNI